MSRGNIQDKLRWIFRLYDINGDGIVSRKELSLIITSLYLMLGKRKNAIDDKFIKDKTERFFEVTVQFHRYCSLAISHWPVFSFFSNSSLYSVSFLGLLWTWLEQRFDLDGDGYISMEEFVSICSIVSVKWFCTSSNEKCNGIFVFDWFQKKKTFSSSIRLSFKVFAFNYSVIFFRAFISKARLEQNNDLAPCAKFSLCH